MSTSPSLESIKMLVAGVGLGALAMSVWSRRSARTKTAPAPSSNCAKLGLGMSHFGIFAYDPEKLSHFYVKILGFTITDRGELPSGALIFMSRDPEEHHQVILCSGRKEGTKTTVNQISLRADNLDVLRGIKRAVEKEEGVTEILPVHHGNAVSLYFKDPEGNRIECFVDTPWYCEQPQRKPVDLNDSDAQLLAKVEAYACTQPKFQPRSQFVANMAEKMSKTNARWMAANFK